MRITPLNCYSKIQYKTNNLFKNQKMNFSVGLNKDTISFTSNQTQNPKVKHNQQLFDREIAQITFSSEASSEERDIYKLALATLWNRTNPTNCAEEGLNAIYKQNTICEIVDDEKNNSKYAVVMNRDINSGTLSVEYYDLFTSFDCHLLCWKNRHVAPACIISEGKEMLLEDIEDAKMQGKFCLRSSIKSKDKMQGLIKQTQAQINQERHLLAPKDKSKIETQDILDDDGKLLKRYTFYSVNQDVESRYRLRKMLDKSVHLERRVLIEEFDSTGRKIKATSCVEFLDDTSLPFQISSIKNYECEDVEYFTTGVNIEYSKENNLRTIHYIENDDRLRDKPSQFIDFIQNYGCENYTFKEISSDNFALSNFEKYVENTRVHFKFYEEQGVTVGKYTQNTPRNNCVFIIDDIVGVAVEKEANQDFSSDEQIPKIEKKQETKTQPQAKEEKTETQTDKKVRLEDMTQEERLKELKSRRKQVDNLLEKFQKSSRNDRKKIRRQIAKLCHSDIYEKIRNSGTLTKEEKRILDELVYIFKTQVS